MTELHLRSASCNVPNCTSCPKKRELKESYSGVSTTEQTLNTDSPSTSSSPQQERWQDAMPDPEMLLEVAAGHATPLLPETSTEQGAQKDRHSISGLRDRQISWLAVHDAMPDLNLTKAIPKAAPTRRRSNTTLVASGSQDHVCTLASSSAVGRHSRGSGVTENPYYSGPRARTSDDVHACNRGGSGGGGDGGLRPKHRSSDSDGYLYSGRIWGQSNVSTQKEGGKGFQVMFLDWLSSLTRGSKDKGSRLSSSSGGNPLNQAADNEKSRPVSYTAMDNGGRRRLSMHMDVAAEEASLPRILSSKEAKMLHRRKSSRSSAYGDTTAIQAAESAATSAGPSSPLLLVLSGVPSPHQLDAKFTLIVNGPQQQRKSLDSTPSVPEVSRTARPDHPSMNPLSPPKASSASPPMTHSNISSSPAIAEAVPSPSRRSQQVSMPAGEAMLDPTAGFLQDGAPLLSLPRMRSLEASGRSRAWAAAERQQQIIQISQHPPLIDDAPSQGSDRYRGPPTLPGSIE